MTAGRQSWERQLLLGKAAQPEALQKSPGITTKFLLGLSVLPPLWEG